jgi:hypothetical protein
MEEVDRALHSMKKGKSGSTSGIVTEMITALVKVVQKCYDLLTMIWEKEEKPDDWKKSIIVPLYTK